MADLVRQLIEIIYCRKYEGYLRVRDIREQDGSHRGWMVSIGLHQDERPLEIAYDGDAYFFLTKLDRRLRTDHLHYTDYYNGYKIKLDGNQDPSTALPPKYIKASII